MMATPMEPSPRHQCLIYEGAPSRQLRAIAAVMGEKLEQNYRCLYLNSPPMVAGMRSYLAAAGVDVTHEIEKESLMLSSEQGHLASGQFDVDGMIRTLEDALDQALGKGYTGLWATGDMTWEMGPKKDFSKLLEYEWRLERFLRDHEKAGGICQYHTDTLPSETVRLAFLAHRSIFVSETLSRLNPHYMPTGTFDEAATRKPELDAAIQRLCQTPAAS